LLQIEQQNRLEGNFVWVSDFAKPVKYAQNNLVDVPVDHDFRFFREELHKRVVDLEGEGGGWVEGGGWRVEGRGWRVEGGGWRVEGGGWRVEGGGWRVEGGGTTCCNRPPSISGMDFWRDSKRS
jgi:hypothetical protein